MQDRLFLEESFFDPQDLTQVKYEMLRRVQKDEMPMGLEVSRLARNSSDWHRLLEICALTKTLLLDEDGLYDPSSFNDRLLLGLKRHDSQSTSCSTFWNSQQI